MPIRPSVGVPMYAVVEDSPARLVLATRASRYFGAGLFGVLATPFLFGYSRQDGPIGTGFGVVGGLLAAAALYSLLSWRRYTFDGARGELRFDSLLFGRSVSRLADIEGIRVETQEKKTLDSDGNAGSYSVHGLFLTVGGRRHEINRSAGGDFIEDLRARIQGMARSAL